VRTCLLDDSDSGFLRNGHRRVREHNEDAYYVDPEGRLFAVADGMGGQNAGEVASSMAIQELRVEMEDSFAKKTCERS